MLFNTVGQMRRDRDRSHIRSSLGRGESALEEISLERIGNDGEGGEELRPIL